MLEDGQFAQFRFAAPGMLWLLVVPAALLVAWIRLLLRRRREAHEYAVRRQLPVREQVSFFGDMLLWLCLLLATSALVLALARPQALVERVRTHGVDMVILADASASMYVQDVGTSRWQRTTRFLGVMGESLRWEGDRIALALFANIAVPQVRLTKDPNTFFFFLEHLGERPPFRLEDDQTWDTNAELGIEWGLRLIAKDAELNGRSANAPVMVMVSDGQVWSGEVQAALGAARARRIPVHVIGVGTVAGGVIPEPPPRPRPQLESERDHEHVAAQAGPQRSSLNRSSLRAIATAGGGQYHELGRRADREIAHAIIEDARRLVGTQQVEERWEDLYWRTVLLATGLTAAGILLSVRTRTELVMSALVAIGTLLGLWRILW